MGELLMSVQKMERERAAVIIRALYEDGALTQEEIWEAVRMGFIEKPPLVPSRISTFISLIQGYIMKDWKTTTSAVIGALVLLVGHFGFNIDNSMRIAIEAVSIAIVGFFARDAKPTSTETH